MRDAARSQREPTSPEVDRVVAPDVEADRSVEDVETFIVVVMNVERRGVARRARELHDGIAAVGVIAAGVDYRQVVQEPERLG